MNIFAVSDNPSTCAQALDDKRLVKMVLETAQLLNTAFHLVTGQQAMYHPSHVRHPCTLWTVESFGNYMWLMRLGNELAAEYRFRYEGRRHGCERALEFCYSYRSHVGERRPRERTPFVNCARNAKLGLDFTGASDVHEAYRAYLRAKWHHHDKNPKWTRRGAPYWA